jgi:FKBP-type peptidyl-prolyl cis-trans isomerase SlyD
MRIAKDTIATIDYELSDASGVGLDSSRDSGPLVYLHGHGAIVPGLEEALEGRSAAEHFQVDVAPERAYGWHDPERVELIPRRALDPDGHVEIGMRFEAETEEGIVVATVVGFEGDDVRVDANHPLAGRELRFDVTVRAVRAATAEEIAHGHPMPVPADAR